MHFSVCFLCFGALLEVIFLISHRFTYRNRMISTKAIVLRTLRYSDSRLIVSLYTEHYGMITSMVRIASSSRGRGGIAIWQLLNILELNVDFRGNSDFQKIGEVCIAAPWKDIPYNPVKACVSMYLAEFLYNCLRNEGENAAIFSFLENSLCWLDETEKGIANFHLVMMLKMTRFLGFWPNTDEYCKTGYFDLIKGTFAPLVPQHGQYITSEEAKYIPYILKIDYANAERLKLSRKERWHMLEVILHYYQLHVPSFAELKSLEILKETFA